MPSSPYSGVSKTPLKAFQTGLEDFNIPWDFGGSQSGSSRSQSSSGSMSMMGGIPEDESEDRDAPGMTADIQKMSQMMQMQKIKDDYKRMVKQAQFFLPRTLQDIAGQYGSQGSYWGSGRRGEQEEASKKTRFDLQQSKADAEFEQAMLFLQQAAQNQAEQGGRSG